MNRTPRALFVGHTAYDLPLTPLLAKKWDVLSKVLEVRVIGSRGEVHCDDPRFRLLEQREGVGRGISFYAALPRIIRQEVQAFGADVVVTQSPFEAAMAFLSWPIRRPPVPIIVDVHGDWRTAATLYGSRWRRLLAWPAVRVASWALRRADSVRAVSGDMAALVQAETGKPPLAVFPAWFDADALFERPPHRLPQVPAALWVGVLQRTKDPATLVAAWPRVAREVGRARLVIVGRGPEAKEVHRLAAKWSERVEVIDWLDPEGVAAQLDKAWVLVLPSRSEGLPRVAIEASARGRAVVGSRVTGIRELVHDEQNGLLVPPGDARALGNALVRVLRDRKFAQQLGDTARIDAERFAGSSQEYARQVRELVDATIAHAS